MLAIYMSYSNGSQAKADPNAYVGIAFGGNTTAETKLFIDRTKTYTNLFILDSGRNPISKNQSSVEEIGDYAVANGLSVIINVGINDVIDGNSWFWQQQSLDSIKQNWTQRWGSKFLGIYYNDEPGGIQLDGNWAKWFRDYGENLSKVGHPATDALYNIYLKMLDYMYNGSKPQDYNLEADFFIQNALKEDHGLAALKTAGITTFTSDYGLYWFDYLGGYDVLFAETGWNASLAQQIALVKGAARLQDKEWGAIITWKYGSAPYLDSENEIYNQMLTAYESGAKYIAVFNYSPKGDGVGLLQEEHFIALQRFWNDITQKKFADLSTPEAALVLPSNYGWGMRNPNDTIWGFWSTDEKSQQIGTIMSKLLARYGASLDILYDDPAYPLANVGYKNVYYWNSTAI